MKFKILFFIISLITIIISLEVFSYYYNEKKYPLFIVQQDDEFWHVGNKLYSFVDPHLGYAHNPSEIKKITKNNKTFFYNSQEMKIIPGDFILYQYKPHNSPVIIAITGGCGTDPFLNGGNWPWALHNLYKQLNVPHKIYNGAVSGYTSSQELIKLVRDIFHLESHIDVVISMNGLGDFPLLDDAKQHHPFVNTYQEQIFLDLMGQSKHFFSDSYLLNLQLFIYNTMKSWGLIKNRINWGVSDKDDFLTHIQNVEYMSIISNKHGAKFLHIIPPTNPALPFEDFHQKEKSKAEKYLDNLQKNLIQRSVGSFMMPKIFTKQKNNFSDYYTLSKKGQRKFVSALVEIIQKRSAKFYGQ